MGTVAASWVQCSNSFLSRLRSKSKVCGRYCCRRDHRIMSCALAKVFTLSSCTNPKLPISLARSAPFPAPDGVSVKRCFRRNTRRTVAFKRTGTTSVIPRRQTRLAEEFHQNGRHKSDRQQHIHRCHPTQQPPFHRQEDVAEPQGREGNERQIDRWL